MVTLGYVEKDYEQLKTYARKALKKGNVNHAISFIQAASHIAYHLRLCYIDDELESLISLVSSRIISPAPFTPVRNRFVFYDCFGWENRGLTQQYLSALEAWGVDFLYILEREKPVKDSYILDLLKKNSKVDIFVVDDSLNSSEKVAVIADKIIDYGPEKAFLHFAPWSVVAVSVWKAFPDVERFFINLTDHAFWLGKGCSDYFIDFREFGAALSIKERGIKKGKIIIQKYYPICKSPEFDGFPVETKGKTILFSGGAYYKTLDYELTFLKLLKKVISENNNILIFYAGTGDDSVFRNFIKKHSLEDWIILIGKRGDLNRVFDKIDIYLNTYPLSGGLMCQYAVYHGKMVVSYAKEEDCSGKFIEGLFEKKDGIQFTYSTFEEYCAQVGRLINDTDYRADQELLLANLVPSESSFAESLMRKVAHEEIEGNIARMDLDTQVSMDRAFETENSYMHDYHKIKLHYLRLSYFKYNIIKATQSVLNVAWYLFRTHLIRVKRRLSRV